MKFKMSKIAAAVVTVGAIGSAQAVMVNPDGLGQVLLYPYYNVNNNFQTNIHIVNTKDESKIIKIRFRESKNSQDVLDFNVYLSPHDVWTGVVRNVNGKANLISNDNSCTIPANNVEVAGVGTLNATGWTFRTNVYDNVTDEDALQGYIEVIEVGVIKDTYYADMNKDNDIDPADDTLIVDGIKHGSDGNPSDCSVVEKAWINGVDTDAGNNPTIDKWGGQNAAAAVGAPTGGLYGHAIYLNNQTGAAYVAQVTAIDHYSTVSQHYLPNDRQNFLLPSLASGDVATSAVVNAAGDTAISPANNWPTTVDATLNDGDSQTPGSGDNPLPIAHVLMAKSVINEYFIDSTFDGATDWVVTFPMRKHGIFNGQYTEDCDQTGPLADTDGTSTTAGTEGTNTCFVDSDKDVEVTFTTYDREEQKPAVNAPDFGVSPPLGGDDTGTVLKNEVNVITFANTTSVLGAPSPISITAPYAAGWMQMDFASKYCLKEDQLSDTTVDFVTTGYDATVCGVPVIGFAALRGTSPVPNASFGETIDHRYLRDTAAPTNP